MDNMMIFIKSLIKEKRQPINELRNITLSDQKKNTFNYNGKEYNFRCLSNFNILKEDKQILNDDIERNKYDLAVSIKIALCKELNNQKFITVVQEDNNLVYLVEYTKNGEKYIINYSLNLIMKKDDYYELYDPREINKLDKIKLYVLMDFYKHVSNNFNLYYIVFFGNEIFEDLKKNFPTIGYKFNSDGMHNNNGYVLDDPYLNNTYDISVNDIDEDIQNFTLGISDDKISFDSENKWYLYDDKIPFRLLSDYLPEHYSSTLKSNDRFKKCHKNSRILLNEIIGSELVSGLIKINDIQYIHHSWVEKDDIVFDFNRNLIMRKKDYYSMTGAKVINRSSKKLIKENSKFFKLLNFDKNSFIFFDNYFSHELNEDLKKHSYLLEKQKDSN